MSLDQPHAFVKHQSVTRDAFLGGRLTVSQPRRGFRAGLDSVLLGAAVGGGRQRLLDLGCGTGVAAMVAMTFRPKMEALLVDQNTEMVELASENLVANGMGCRARVLLVDVTARGSVRKDRGVAENAYDVVIANPPFFAEHAGTLAADNGRAGSRHMSAEALDAWVKTAATSASAAGEAIFIYPVESLSPLLAAFSQRFGNITVLPLTPRPGEPVTRVLVRGIKGSRAPLSMLASRALHEAEGRHFAREFNDIFRGQAPLNW